MNSAHADQGNPSGPASAPGLRAPAEFAVASGVGLGLLLLIHGLAFGGGAVWQWGPAVAIYAAGAAAFAAMFRRHYPFPGLGLCNLVTLARFVLVAFLITPLAFGLGGAWLVPGVAALALSLDGVDGWLARAAGRSSACGARFDMEVDAVLSVVLATGALWTGRAGAAVLILGLTRYVFVAAGTQLPWLRAPLPERFGRKAVCILQLGTLILLHLPPMPRGLGDGLVALASLVLIWSFGRDILWLWRART